MDIYQKSFLEKLHQINDNIKNQKLSDDFALYIIKALNNKKEIYKDILFQKYKLTHSDKIKDAVNIHFIKKGLKFAVQYHGAQLRKSGDPYYSHPIAVLVSQ